MCGFIGRINSVAAGNARSLSAGLKFINRRGPDSNRQWTSLDTNVELLHARLAIVDTDSRAQQPFTDEENRVTVAFNGEIYNYRELRAGISDYNFRTTSDTEVIIALYVTRGIAGLQKLRGMFGLCIVDEQVRRVFLARDPIGKKPLFLARWHEGTYFGSSVLALLAASGNDGQLSSTAIKNFWDDGHVGPDDSLVEGCTPVCPGRVIELDWDGKLAKIGSCTPKREDFDAADLQTVKERVGEHISRAVQRRLSNNAKPLSLLSGGIDSTVVTSHMQMATAGSAITLGSLVPGMNDERYARFASKRIGVPLQVVRSRPSDIASDVVWSLDLQDEPLGMISFFPLALMIRAAKQHGRILLTGDGGDEVFLGYGKPEDWVVPGRTANGNGPADWMTDWGKKMVTTSLLGHMFTKLDRASAEQGVETRCPLLDWDLVSFVRTLPPDSLFFDGRSKALLKAQLSDWPESFIDRPKIGFAYNLRWAWSLNRFGGLRELVSEDAIERFSDRLPVELRSKPSQWGTLTLFKNFPAIWKLLAWSRFSERLRLAREQSTQGTADRVYTRNGRVSSSPLL